MEFKNGFSPFPAFFRTYNSDEHSQHVVVPCDYIQYYPKPLPETAVLKKPAEERFWNVKWTLSEVETISFKDGWSKFVTDNGLIDEDKVFFNYDGSRTFWICLYRNGLPVKSKAPINIQEISDDESETNGGDDDDDDMETEEDSNENKIISLSLGSSDEDTTISEVNKASGTSKKVRSSIGRYSRQKLVGSIGDPDTYLDDPLNPYFVARSSSKRNELVIARQVIKDYDLKFGDTITVIDGCGELMMKIGQWKDRFVVSKWNQICKRNDVKPEDCFVCEILREGGLVHAIKVHFFKK